MDSPAYPWKWWLILLTVGVVYAAQLASPLRLNVDVADFLRMARSGALERGLYPTPETCRYPPGYPAMVAALARAKLADERVLIGMNIAAVGAGAAAAYGVSRRSGRVGIGASFLVVVLTLMSFVMIKHVTLSVSDTMYFGLSMSALYAARRAEMIRGPDGFWWLSVALALAMIAILVRIIGVALLPALLWAWMAGDDHGDQSRPHRENVRPAMLFAALLMFLGFAAVVMLGQVYVRDGLSRVAAGSLWTTWLGRLTELGEIALNAPHSRLPTMAPAFLIAGAMLAAACAASLRAAVRCRAVTSDQVYLVTFIAILLLWPYNDARFWLPVIPLIWLTILGCLRPWLTTRWRIAIAATLLAMNLLGGAAALTYSTRLSWSGARFADRYGDASIRQAYRIAWGMESPENASSEVLDMVDLLRRFDRRTRAALGPPPHSDQPESST
jgi:hypothetical protein